MTIHIFFTYPETKGRTLEEIDEVFDSKTPAWRSDKIKSRFEDVVGDVQRKGSIAVDDGEKDQAITKENV